MSNIYDVAKAAGVSRSTVSRVINSKKEVNEETRAAVFEAMNKLNYRPNSAARSLALKKNNAIGVVSAGFTDSFYSEMLDIIHKKSDEMGYGALFYIQKYDSKTNINYMDLLYGKVDGFIFLGENIISPREISNCLQLNCPVVLVGNKSLVEGCTNVQVDNFNGAYKATDFLIKSGHTKIAHLHGNPESSESTDRYKGFIKALTDSDLSVDKELVKVGNYLYNDAYTASVELLKSSQKFTAIFCSNDIMAVAFIQAAFDFDIKIPDDISVIGFDDIKTEKYFSSSIPSLTSIRQPRHEMAEYAVSSLIKNINTDTITENKIFDTNLVIRESCKNLLKTE